MVLGLTFVLRWAATGDARVARDDGCESVERRGGWRRRCSHGAGPGTVMRGREVGRREVEGSAVRRRRVGMPCGFASEGRVVTSESYERNCNTRHQTCPPNRRGELTNHPAVCDAPLSPGARQAFRRLRKTELSPSPPRNRRKTLPPPMGVQVPVVKVSRVSRQDVAACRQDVPTCRYGSCSCSFRLCTLSLTFNRCA